MTLVELGKLYIQKGDFQDATRCLQKVLGTQPLYPADEEQNSELHETAQQMLNDIQQPISAGLRSAGCCPRCGQSILSGARFCTSCGTPVGTSRA